MFQSIPSYYRYVSSITIGNSGSNYTSVPTITISGGGGTGATATATIFNGEIQTVTVTNIGANYDSAPTVTVSGGGGSGAVLTAVLSFASGTSTEYQEKSALTSTNVVPSFVQEEYSKFVTFLDKYYEFMDQAGNPTNKLLNDNYFNIDDANDSVLDKWALQLAKDFPKTLEIDRKTFYKNVKNIYESKGSERSIKAFFRLLYAEEIEIYYPAKDILKASDGRWIVENSVRAVAGFNNYEALQLSGKLCDIIYYSTTGSATVDKRIPATVQRVEKIAYTSPQRYELVLQFDTAITDIPGPGSQGTATATVVGGEITEITVTNGGYGYTAAPVVRITDSSVGTGAEARANVLDGAITSITVIDGGSDYTESSTTIELDTNTVRSFIVDRGQTTSESNVRAYLERTLATVSSAAYSGADAGFKVGNVFSINETGDDGRAYALDYFSEDYTYIGGGNKAYIKVSEVNSANVPSKWSILNSGSGFLNAQSTITIVSPTGENLDINLTTDYLFSYDGKYSDDRGKLSDVNRLQDNFKYQNYSYIVKSSLPSSVWIKKFKNVAHTAGMEVFGDIVITNKIDYASNISYEIDGGLEISIFKVTDTTLASEVIALDLNITLATDTATTTDLPAFSVSKFFTDNTIDSGVSSDIGVNDSGLGTYFAEDYCDESYCRDPGIEISVAKILDENLSVLDVFAPEMSFTRSFADSSTASENFVSSINYGREFSDSISSITDNFTFEIFIPLDLTDSVSHQSDLSLAIAQQLFSNNVATTSGISIINIDKALVENQTASESAVINLDKPFTDTGTSSDSGVITIQDYVDPTYFSEDYVGAGYSF